MGCASPIEESNHPQELVRKGKAHARTNCFLCLYEICSKVVDCEFLEERGVPSQRVSWQIQRCNVGGKDTPACKGYAKTRRHAKSSCSTSTESPAKGPG